MPGRREEKDLDMGKMAVIVVEAAPLVISEPVEARITDMEDRTTQKPQQQGTNASKQR
ncbi:protein of unknown function [Pseudodesulfovibrio profundus]|uniref:Uncharacterized protein n=1 Tax=Pseudodesulfovibrio profundus TaxID=57320 RepID=A0A2C8F8F7_9BACT|nr:protein of unknown function [Pseudodesulfovibrio profundus]